MNVEFDFELRLAAHLEWDDHIVSRQLGSHVAGRRVMDLICVEPGPEFDDRVRLTPEAIPPAAIESDVGPGQARYWKDAFECHPERAETAIEAAVDCGFFERERRNGRTYVRQTARYPNWFDGVVGIENKPDLGRPGALQTQLLTDVELGLLDEIVLATASHVTGAHRNRIPSAVGIWEFDPVTGERTVVREPTRLPVDETGIEILERTPTRADIEIASPSEKESARRRIAERAYGKGWRTFDFPACGQIEPTDAGLPYCQYFDKIVRPVTDCGAGCDAFDPSAPPDIDTDALRGERTPWNPEVEHESRQQAGLSDFTERLESATDSE